MNRISVTEASRHFSDLVNRAYYGGESALLIKGGRPVAKIVPARQARTGRDLAARWPNLPHLDAAGLEAFAEDVDAARRALLPVKSKWA
jgi:prevent-host-death family protein